MLKQLMLLLAAALLSPLAQPAAQEVFPSRPLTFIVPFAPGADTDGSARLIAQGVEVVLRQPVVVINRPGAGGRIGMNAGAAAAADGYTLTIATPSAVTQPFMNRRGGNRALDRFEAVALPAGVPFLLMIPANRPWTTLREFVAFARANPGRINFSNPGEGSYSHLIPLIMEGLAGIEFTHVAYRGGAPASVALLNGEVDALLIGPGSMQAHLRSGALRGIAIGTAARYPLLPEIATFREQGVETEAITWWGYLAPKGTPPERIRILADAIRAAADMPAFRDMARRNFWVTDFYGPAEFAAYIQRQEEVLGPHLNSLIERGVLSRAD